jgi:NlpC/P60 family
MRRLWFLLLIVLSLAACSSAPPTYTRAGGGDGATSDALRTRPSGLPNFVDHSIGREEISIEAMSLVGVPYRWAGNTPASGFDCSGLVQYVIARAADVKLPRTTADISQRGQPIDPGEIAPGDLVFFNTTGRPHSHVGIYVGKLRFVNAPSTGGTVRLDYLTNPYWAKRFDGIRRVAAPLTRPSPFDAPTYVASPRETPDDPTRRLGSSPGSMQARTSVAQGAEASAVTPAPAASIDGSAPASISGAADGYQPLQDARSSSIGDTTTESAVADTRTVAPLGPAATRVPSSTAGNASANRRPPDAIAAAADAFEPPPPAAALAERQARQGGARSVAPQAPPGAQIMRASAMPSAQPAPTATNDDPIAGFANSGE